MTLREITTRLAACIYFADYEARNRPTVLWDMVPVSQQQFYYQQAAKVLKYAAIHAEKKDVRQATHRRGARASIT